LTAVPLKSWGKAELDIFKKPCQFPGGDLRGGCASPGWSGQCRGEVWTISAGPQVGMTRADGWHGCEAAKPAGIEGRRGGLCTS